MSTTKRLRRVGVLVFLGIAALGWAAALLFFVVAGTWAIVQLAMLGPSRVTVTMSAFFVLAGAAVFPFWLKFGRALWWQISDTIGGRPSGPGEWWAAQEHSLAAPRPEAGAPPEHDRGRRPPHPASDAGVRRSQTLAVVFVASSLVAYGLALASMALFGPMKAWWPRAVAWGLAGVASVCATTPWMWRAKWSQARLWLLAGGFWLIQIWSLARPVSGGRAGRLLLMWAVLLFLIRWRPGRRPG